MSHNEPSEVTPPAVPNRQFTENRLELKLPHLARTRYRLLNLNEFVKKTDEEEPAGSE